MISLHGWAVIKESYNEEGESERALVEALSRIQGQIDQILDVQGRIDMPPFTSNIEADRRSNTVIRHAMLNGTNHLSVMADWNHKDGRWTGIYDLFELIAATAPGSYGLLYMRDDEDKLGRDNSMQVYVLKKGTFLEASDNYLSPCIAEIEEV